MVIFSFKNIIPKIKTKIGVILARVIETPALPLASAVYNKTHCAMTKRLRIKIILYCRVVILLIVNLNIKTENKAISPARIMYNVGALMVCRVLRRYFEGIDDNPNRTQEVNAGSNVADLKFLKFLGSMEKITTRNSMPKARIKVCNWTVSARNNQLNRKVKNGTSERIGAAIPASVFSNVLK